MTAAAVAAIAAACPRYPPASRTTGDHRSATAAANGASTAAGTSSATAIRPATVAPPCPEAETSMARHNQYFGAMNSAYATAPPAQVACGPRAKERYVGGGMGNPHPPRP